MLLADADDVERRRAAELSFDYGKNLGLAFQIQDDILDLVGDLETLGKEPGSDLREGITTAPVLFALEQRPELREMIEVSAQRMLSSSFTAFGPAFRASWFCEGSLFGCLCCRCLIRICFD